MQNIQTHFERFAKIWTFPVKSSIIKAIFSLLLWFIYIIAQLIYTVRKLLTVYSKQTVDNDKISSYHLDQTSKHSQITTLLQRQISQKKINFQGIYTEILGSLLKAHHWHGSVCGACICALAKNLVWRRGWKFESRDEVKKKKQSHPNIDLNNRFVLLCI